MRGPCDQPSISSRSNPRLALQSLLFSWDCGDTPTIGHLSPDRAMRQVSALRACPTGGGDESEIRSMVGCRRSGDARCRGIRRGQRSHVDCLESDLYRLSRVRNDLQCRRRNLPDALLLEVGHADQLESVRRCSRPRGSHRSSRTQGDRRTSRSEGEHRRKGSARFRGKCRYSWPSRSEGSNGLSRSPGNPGRCWRYRTQGEHRICGGNWSERCHGSCGSGRESLRCWHAVSCVWLRCRVHDWTGHPQCRNDRERAASRWPGVASSAVPRAVLVDRHAVRW
jgi:hypothetical protein